MEIDKDKELLKIKRQFNKILKQVPEDKKPIATSLVKELAFMALTLDDLKLQVQEGGTVEMFKQGSQEFLRESPALKAYNTTVQRYSLLYKQLTELLPKAAQDTQEDALYEFIKAN
jgi:hypothetical protein